jgi:fluoride exporter
VRGPAAVGPAAPVEPADRETATRVANGPYQTPFTTLVGASRMTETTAHTASDRQPPADSDVDPHLRRQRTVLLGAPWRVLAVISAGGALGALARYGLGTAFQAPTGGFPWATFAVNVTGCLLIGVLMVLVTDVWTGRRHLRPFLGVGVLGGYTTFSTYIVDIQRLVAAGAAPTALAYLAGTLAAALAATWLAVTATRGLLRLRHRHRGQR